MPDTAALLGYGAKVSVASADSPDNFTELAEITNIKPPSATVDMIDVTHMQSPDRRREFIAGLIDPGECSFDMNYVPGSESDVLLNEILDAAADERRRRVRMTFPNNVRFTFWGELMTYEPDVPTDDKMSAAVSFRVSGAITRDTVDSPA